MIASRKFQRTKESFVCENCGFFMKGDGYTNHCSKCLWSKHVDINPGDRLAECFGLMEPVEAETKKGEHRIIHRCVECGYEKKNKTERGDNFNIILAL